MILESELLNKLEYIYGQAHGGSMLGGSMLGGSMLGGDDAYCACMEIMKVTVKLISQIRGDMHE